MRKTIFIFLAVLSLVFLIYSASAQVVLSPQPSGIYNVGDTIGASNLTVSDLFGGFSVYLVCGSNRFLLGPSYFSSGVPYIPSFTLNSSDVGTCSIDSYDLNNQLLSSTQDFQVSNLIYVNVSAQANQFNPGQQISVTGAAVKANGQPVNGVASVGVSFGNISVYPPQNTSVINGNFSSVFSLSGNSPAGQYFVKVNAYEITNGIVSQNTGFSNFIILVNQVPTTLNIISPNNQSVFPGRIFSVETILYDQSGREITAPVSYTVRDSSGNLIEQEQKNTNEILNIPVSYNDAPGSWTVSASSDNLTAQMNFSVLANPEISVALLNNTILVTNTGNVPYNNPLVVNLGNRSVTFNVSVGVGGSQKYVLTAPSGYYPVEISSQGNSLFTGGLTLAGNAVNVQQASQGVISFVQYPWVWFAVIIILVFVIFFLFRRARKKRFMKKVSFNRHMPRSEIGMMVVDERDRGLYKNRMIESRNIADLSLSIYGNKQNASIVCVDIKNFEEIKSKKGGVDSTMNRLKSIAEDFKATVYENRGFFFFIFAPLKTGTMKNEMAAVQAADQIKRVLQDHNRLLKQKIHFGISAHYGQIVAKENGRNGLTFMSLGNFVPAAKRLASIANDEILLSREIRELLMSDVRAEKRSSGNLDFYAVQGIKDRQKSDKFTKEFMSKLEKENRERGDSFNPLGY